jgi:virulence factor Mce-like protein
VKARLAVAAALLAIAPGCSVINSGPASDHFVAYFPRTVAFYTHSRVKLLGVNVGLVDSIAIDGARVRVAFSVDHGVPLPADVIASIMPLSLIGERNLTLSPAWMPGMPRLADGSVITNTHVPIEVDDILKAITDLANALNPNDVRALVTSAAAALNGRGADLNNALAQAASLSGTLADQDQQLLEVAANIHQLASTLDSRQQQLGTVIDDFSQVTQILAGERNQLVAFLAAIAELAQQGQVLLSPVQQQLPGDVATLAQVALTIQANATQVSALLTSLGGLAHAVTSAFDPSLQMFVIKVNLTSSVYQVLKPLLTSLGITLPCLPLPGQTCAG